MAKDLTTSRINRQNILNNRYAVTEIQKAIGLKGVYYNGTYWVTKAQIADFLEISQRTIDNIVHKNEQELRENGYALLTGNELKMFKLQYANTVDNEINFAIKTQRIALFDFRAFLDLTMLVQRSDKAKQIRSLILDIVIDTINQRTGGATKYINQRDEDFLISLLSNADYHKEFVQALQDYIDMGRVKYAIYTNKIYKSIFKENANEYRNILRLEAEENERNTMYSEVLDLIAAYETGYASELQKKADKLGRMLSSHEADIVFTQFENQALWIPLREKARQKMASRDLCFRNVMHSNLREYISSVSTDDFDRFIGENSMTIEDRIESYVDALKRLKDRE